MYTRGPQPFGHQGRVSWNASFLQIRVAMVSVWFKHITFTVHFISISVTSAPTQIIRHQILEVGTPDNNPDGPYSTLSLEQILLWEWWAECIFQGQGRAEEPLTWVYHTGELTVAPSWWPPLTYHVSFIISAHTLPKHVYILFLLMVASSQFPLYFNFQSKINHCLHNMWNVLQKIIILYMYIFKHHSDDCMSFPEVV